MAIVGVFPDLVTYGKVIGGTTVGAIAEKLSTWIYLLQWAAYQQAH